MTWQGSQVQSLSRPPLKSLKSHGFLSSATVMNRGLGPRSNQTATTRSHAFRRFQRVQAVASAAFRGHVRGAHVGDRGAFVALSRARFGRRRRSSNQSATSLPQGRPATHPPPSDDVRRGRRRGIRPLVACRGHTFAVKAPSLSCCRHRCSDRGGPTNLRTPSPSPAPAASAGRDAAHADAWLHATHDRTSTNTVFGTVSRASEMTSAPLALRIISLGAPR